MCSRRYIKCRNNHHHFFVTFYIKKLLFYLPEPVLLRTTFSFVTHFNSFNLIIFIRCAHLPSYYVQIVIFYKLFFF